jgi:hypothetical protein
LFTKFSENHTPLKNINPRKKDHYAELILSTSYYEQQNLLLFMPFLNYHCECNLWALCEVGVLFEELLYRSLKLPRIISWKLNTLIQTFINHKSCTKYSITTSDQIDTTCNNHFITSWLQQKPHKLLIRRFIWNKTNMHKINIGK